MIDINENKSKSSEIILENATIIPFSTVESYSPDPPLIESTLDLNIDNKNSFFDPFPNEDINEDETPNRTTPRTKTNNKNITQNKKGKSKSLTISGNVTHSMKHHKKHKKHHRKIELFSRTPSFSKNGYSLNFHGLTAIPSTKNAILVNKSKDCTSLYVRKVEKNSLEITSFQKFKPIYLFIIGLVSFITPS